MDLTAFTDVFSNAFKTPFEFGQLLVFILFFTAIAVAILFASSIPLIDKYLKEKEIYEFIIEFKGLSEKETELIEFLIKKHRVKPKHKFLTSQSSFFKYINMEVVAVEESNLSNTEKIDKINFYNGLKKKLFHTDK